MTSGSVWWCWSEAWEGSGAAFWPPASFLQARSQPGPSCSFVFYPFSSCFYSIVIKDTALKERISCFISQITLLKGRCDAGNLMLVFKWLPGKWIFLLNCETKSFPPLIFFPYRVHQNQAFFEWIICESSVIVFFFRNLRFLRHLVDWESRNY